MNYSYKNKYLKYKSKYLKLKNQLGGADPAQPANLNYQGKDYECEHLNWITKQEDFNSQFSNKNYKIMLGTKNDNNIEIKNEDYDKDTRYANYYECYNKEKIISKLKNMNIMNEELQSKIEDIQKDDIEAAKQEIIDLRKQSIKNNFEILKQKYPDVKEEEFKKNALKRYEEEEFGGWYNLTPQEIVKFQIYCGPGGSWGENKKIIILQSLLSKYNNYLFMFINECEHGKCHGKSNACSSKNGMYNVFIINKNKLHKIPNYMFKNLEKAEFKSYNSENINFISELTKKAKIDILKKTMEQYNKWLKAAKLYNSDEEDVIRYYKKMYRKYSDEYYKLNRKYEAEHLRLSR